MTSLLSPLQNLFHRAAAPGGQDPLCAQVKQLPRRTQQVFLLSRVDDLPYASIAARLDLALEDVEKEMVRALVQTRRDSPQVAPASQWYVRLQSPLTTASDRIDFRRWLDADAPHLHAFHETELHWRRLLAPARQLAAQGGYQQKRRHRETGAWLAGLISMVVLMILAL
jgi:hypothetical protein